MAKLEKLAKSYRVDHGHHFRLKDFDPDDHGSLRSEEHASEALEKGIEQLRELQDKLYAQDRWALLLIFQGMDAGGKDSAIKHVMSGVNPQGCQVYSFKQPSVEELNHDYLWRCQRHLPQRGRIGIFNRSYYEEVLVVRVHPEALENERIPPSLAGKEIWEQRFDDICTWERYLAHNGVVIRKFFLNLSKKEQAKRFLARLDEPEKNWKFSASDIHERKYWHDYRQAYQEAIRHTSTPEAPWYVVPADHKWFTRLVVASAIVDTLEELRLGYPRVDAARRKELEQARKLLKSEKARG